MADLPPEMDLFGALLEAQPNHIQEVFKYCACRAMVEAGLVRVIKTTPGECGPVLVIELTSGNRLRIARPPISEKDEAVIVEQLRNVIKYGGDEFSL